MGSIGGSTGPFHGGLWSCLSQTSAICNHHTQFAKCNLL